MFPDVGYASSVNESNESFAAQSASRLHLADSANGPKKKKKKNYMYQAAGTNAEVSVAMINESSGAVPGKGHVLVQLCLTHIDGLGDEKGGPIFFFSCAFFPRRDEASCWVGQPVRGTPKDSVTRR